MFVDVLISILKRSGHFRFAESRERREKLRESLNGKNQRALACGDDNDTESICAREKKKLAILTKRKKQSRDSGLKKKKKKKRG